MLGGNVGLDQRARASTRDLVVSYSPAKVELAGEVILHRYFGPNKFDAPILRLDRPIAVKGGAGDFNADTFSGIDRVQLVGKQWKSLCGRKVRLVGTLDEPDSGNFDTKVIMTVERVQWQGQAGRCVTVDRTHRH